MSLRNLSVSYCNPFAFHISYWVTVPGNWTPISCQADSFVFEQCTVVRLCVCVCVQLSPNDDMRSDLIFLIN